MRRAKKIRKMRKARKDKKLEFSKFFRKFSNFLLTIQKFSHILLYYHRQNTFADGEKRQEHFRSNKERY